MTQERKCELFEKMLEWICEHISDEGDLAYTLLDRMGMTQEELYDSGIDYLDCFTAMTKETQGQTTTNSDIYPMSVNEFISTLRTQFDCQDDKLIFDWLELNANLAEEDESELSRNLGDTARALCFVKNNFNETTLHKTLTYPTLANEIISCAVLFHCMQPIEIVRHYAENGIIECGYIPKSSDEEGTLTLVCCEGKERTVFLSHDIPIDELREMVEQTLYKAKEIDSDTGKMLENLFQTDKRIHCFGKDVIGAYMLNIFAEDKDCSAFGYRINCIPSIEAIETEKHPALLATEQKTAENDFTDDMDGNPCDDESQGFLFDMQ